MTNLTNLTNLTKIGRRSLLVCILIQLTNMGFAQTHISGELNLNVEKGIVEGKILMSNIPKDQKLSLILNRGLNIKFVKENGKDIYAEAKELAWDNIEYDLYPFVNGTSIMESHTDIYLEYSGKYPTYSGNERAGSDDMGVIAIKNGIIRSSFQSPIIPYLKQNDLSLSCQTVDLKVNCSKSSMVFLNGNEPQYGKQVIFKNDIPTNFLLYAGNYKTQTKGNVILLNTELKQIEISIISDEIDRIRSFYDQKLGIPYNSKVVLPQIFTIGPENQYTEWGFTVSPTIVLDYNKFTKRIDLQNKTVDLGFSQVMAHEMAHKYFGGILVTSSNLWHFYSESIAQYLAFKYLEEIKSKEVYQNKLRENTLNEYYKAKSLPNFYEIENSTVIITNASYDYYYLYLLGFEKEFGIAKTYQLLRMMLKNNQKIGKGSDLFKDCALEIGISIDHWMSYENRYLKSNNCIAEFELSTVDGAAKR